MIITYLAGIVALFFAMNIGASGAAASVSVAYGSGAIQTRKRALLLCAIAIFLGAVIGGGEVAETIGTGIIPQTYYDGKGCTNHFSRSGHFIIYCESVRNPAFNK